MANPAENALSEVLAAYAFAGEVVGAARFGQGHINDTFCVYTQTAEGDCVRYILQRMSAAAFKHPDQLMQNIVGVTDYLRDLIEKNGGDAARDISPTARAAHGACIPLWKIRCACRKQKRRSCSMLPPRRSAISNAC